MVDFYMDSQKTLPKDICRVLVALMNQFVPPGSSLDVKGMDQVLVHDCARLVHEFSPLTRFFFIFALRFFEWSPLLHGFGFTRFSHLSLVHQEKYLRTWENSRFEIKQNVYKAFRGLVFLIFFSQTKVWEYIGYNPRAHVDFKIKQRQEILTKASEG